MEIVIDMAETPDSRPYTIGERCYWIFYKMEPVQFHKNQKCSKCGDWTENRTIYLVTKVYHEIEEFADYNPDKAISTIYINTALGRDLLRKTQVFHQRIFCTKCL